MRKEKDDSDIEIDDFDNPLLPKAKQRELQRKQKNSEFTKADTFRHANLVNEKVGSAQIVEQGYGSKLISQKEILDSLPVAAQNSIFDLKFKNNGPYKLNYSHNGKFVAIAGSEVGHLAAFDWEMKKPLFDINVNDKIFDVAWLNNETRLSVAQKNYLYIYNNLGVEQHRLKILANPRHLTFLYYHMLLCVARKSGFLSYLDVTMGKSVADIKTDSLYIQTICQNRTNGLVYTADNKGVVSLYSPSVDKPLVKVRCHPYSCISIACNNSVDECLFATADACGYVKIWDNRNFKCVKKFKMQKPVKNLVFSQKNNMLAFNSQNVVEVYKNVDTEKCLYIRERLKPNTVIGKLEFCPFNDVLAIGHSQGFRTIIVPGSGDPNFDAFEGNVYETVKQRQEREVKMLLDKIQPELIVKDVNSLFDKGLVPDNIDDLKAEKSINKLMPKMPKRAKTKKKLMRTQLQVKGMIDREKRVQKAIKKIQDSNKAKPI